MSEAEPKAKLRFTVAYDGTAYQGWQLQKVGVGVQEKVEAAIQKIFPGADRVQGASRTDTGVHALGMEVHVEIPRKTLRMPIARIALALNAHLPEDVRVMKVRRCKPEFHARFDAVGKQYRYLVWCGPVINPLLRTQAWHVTKALNLKAMREAAKPLVGKHDFRSFAATRPYYVENTVRTVWRLEIRRSGPILTFIIEGNGFLYRMCRGLVGTLVQVGEGKIGVGTIAAMLESKDRREGGMSAPAHGLVLWTVFYKKPRTARI